MADIDINKLAVLSRLTLSSGEAEQAKERLEEMLKLMENIRKLDLSSVENITENEPSVLREDIPEQGFNYAQAFLNAPQHENNHFVIPKVIS